MKPITKQKIPKKRFLFRFGGYRAGIEFFSVKLTLIYHKSANWRLHQRTSDLIGELAITSSGNTVLHPRTGDYDYIDELFSN